MRRSSIHKGIRRIFGGWIPTPIIIYILMLLAVYALPIGLEGEWYNFYEYMVY